MGWRGWVATISVSSWSVGDNCLLKWLTVPDSLLSCEGYCEDGEETTLMKISSMMERNSMMMIMTWCFFFPCSRIRCFFLGKPTFSKTDEF